MDKITQHPSSAPLGCTNDVTVSRDLQASKDATKIAEILTETRNVSVERALRGGELVLRWSDPGVYDAGVWRAAERLYDLMDPTASVRRLIAVPDLRVRQFYLTCAMHAIRGFEDVLTGTVHTRNLQQAHADYHSHRIQVLQRSDDWRAQIGKDTGK